MKNKYLFGFTCKMPTQKETKSIITGKTNVIDKIIILGFLPKTEEAINTIERYNFSPEFNKIIESICRSIKSKKTAYIENLPIEKISYICENKNKKEVITIQGNVHITYFDILSGLGGSWEIPRSEDLSYIVSLHLQKKRGYIFLSMKK